jgi:hypothetical protein
MIFTQRNTPSFPNGLLVTREIKLTVVIGAFREEISGMCRITKKRIDDSPTSDESKVHLTFQCNLFLGLFSSISALHMSIRKQKKSGGRDFNWLILCISFFSLTSSFFHPSCH